MGVHCWDCKPSHIALTPPVYSISHWNGSSGLGLSWHTIRTQKLLTRKINSVLLCFINSTIPTIIRHFIYKTTKKKKYNQKIPEVVKCSSVRVNSPRFQAWKREEMATKRLKTNWYHFINTDMCIYIYTNKHLF